MIDYFDVTEIFRNFYRGGLEGGFREKVGVESYMWDTLRALADEVSDQGHRQTFRYNLKDVIENGLITEEHLKVIQERFAPFKLSLENSVVLVSIYRFSSREIYGMNFVQKQLSNGGLTVEIHINTDLYVAGDGRRERQNRKIMAAHEWLEALHTFINFPYLPESDKRTVSQKTLMFTLLTGQSPSSDQRRLPWSDNETHLDSIRRAWQDLLVSRVTIKRLCEDSQVMSGVKDSQHIKGIDDLREQFLKCLEEKGRGAAEAFLERVSEQFSTYLHVPRELIHRRIEETVIRY